MVNASIKTPAKKKGVANKNTPGGKTPKGANGFKTPGKGAGTPGKPNKTPKSGFVPHKFVRPPQDSEETEPTPPKKTNKTKRSSESSNEGTSPKKLKMFQGTANLEQAKGKKTVEAEKDATPQEKKQRKTSITSIREKATSGDKSVIGELDVKLKELESRENLSKTAKRKLKLFKKLKSLASGEPLEVTSPPAPKPKGQVKTLDTAGKKKKAQPVIAVKEPEEDDDSSESDEDVDTEITPGNIIKTAEDEDSGEEEEESSDDQEEVEGAEEEVEGDEEEEVEGVEDAKPEEASDDEDEASDDEDEASDDDEANVKEDEDSGSDDSVEEAPTAAPKEVKTFKPAKAAPSQVEQSNRPESGEQKRNLFVSGLPVEATVEEITEHFTQAGKIHNIHVPRDRNTNQFRGIAFVEYEDDEGFQAGLNLNDSTVKEQTIHVRVARDRNQGGPRQFGGNNQWGGNRPNQFQNKNWGNNRPNQRNSWSPGNNQGQGNFRRQGQFGGNFKGRQGSDGGNFKSGPRNFGGNQNKPGKWGNKKEGGFGGPPAAT